MGAEQLSSAAWMERKTGVDRGRTGEWWMLNSPVVPHGNGKKGGKGENRMAKGAGEWWVVESSVAPPSDNRGGGKG